MENTNSCAYNKIMKMMNIIYAMTLVASLLGGQFAMAGGCPMQMGADAQMQGDMQMMDCHQSNIDDVSNDQCAHCAVCHLSFVYDLQGVTKAQKHFIHYNNPVQNAVSAVAHLNLPPPKHAFFII
ncbi:MAG: hypothetical protein VX154_07240 [Pseudomonadota bacterium]|nr:hypothetical protein [Pseudomonadota bacterium]